jgi:hypothetical protein
MDERTDSHRQLRDDGVTSLSFLNAQHMSRLETLCVSMRYSSATPACSKCRVRATADTVRDLQGNKLSAIGALPALPALAELCVPFALCAATGFQILRDA